MITDRLETSKGFLDYQYQINENYPSGLIVLMGGFVNKECRGQGEYSRMIERLFNSFPIGTIIQAQVVNKGLIPYFTRLGFKKVECIEYWGKSSKNMEGKIL